MAPGVGEMDSLQVADIIVGTNQRDQALHSYTSFS